MRHLTNSRYRSIKAISTWLLPDRLDIPRLKEALSLTLRDFPHCAGRLAYDGSKKEWSVYLANDAVPLTVGKNTDVYMSEQFMKGPRHRDIADTSTLDSWERLRTLDSTSLECPTKENTSGPLTGFKVGAKVKHKFQGKLTPL